MKNKFILRINSKIRRLDNYKIDSNVNSIKLNQNELPFDLPMEMKKKIAESLVQEKWNRYPDLKYENLLKAGAGYYKVDTNSIFPAKGSNEIIFALYSSLAGRKKSVITTRPSYSMYKILGKRLGVNVKSIPFGRDFQYPVKKLKCLAGKRKTGLILLCSPNNPTGNTISQDALEELLSVSGSFIAIDEAYAEFSNQNFIPLVKKYKNLLVIKTLSKYHGLAGLRIGWIIGNPDFIKIFKKAFLPYHIDIFSMTAAAEYFKSIQADYLAKNIIFERNKLYIELTKIGKIKVFPSEANFILVEPKQNALTIYKELLKYGIIVRNVSDYKGLSNHLRISIGTPAQNKKTVEALRSILNSVS